MVKRAQQQAVAQAGRAALAARDDVMHVAPGGRDVAAGGGAVLVSGGDRPPQVRRYQVGDGADVQRQADRPGGRGQGAGPQPRREAAGPGQQRDRLPQDQLAGGGQVPLRPRRPVASSRIVVWVCRQAERVAAAGQAAARRVPGPGWYSAQWLARRPASWSRRSWSTRPVTTGAIAASQSSPGPAHAPASTGPAPPSPPAPRPRRSSRLGQAAEAGRQVRPAGPADPAEQLVQ